MTKKQTTPSLSNEEMKEEPKASKTNVVHVQALWKSFTPDCRPYKPSTPQIEFPEPLIIAIDVPLEIDLIKNADKIDMAVISNQPEPKPNFTPLGMRYIIDQFEAAMQSGKQEEDQVPEASNDDWGDDEKAPEEKAFEEEDAAKKKPAKASSDDEWSDEDETDQPGVEKPEEDFDEDWS